MHVERNKILILDISGKRRDGTSNCEARVFSTIIRARSRHVDSARCALVDRLNIEAGTLSPRSEILLLPNTHGKNRRGSRKISSNVEHRARSLYDKTHFFYSSLYTIVYRVPVPGIFFFCYTEERKGFDFMRVENP